ncbi:hypothetical protein ACA910_003904 [Epithemia clementina (nom. ined.)]
MTTNSNVATSSSSGKSGNAAGRATSSSSSLSSPATATTAALTVSIPPTPQVRHAGRAHVRGKYRRVWRPRYLELLDQGIVRYYEFPSASGTGTQITGQSSPTTSTSRALYASSATSSPTNAEDSSWQYMMMMTSSGNNNNSNNNSGEFKGSSDDVPLLSSSTDWTPKYVLQISHARILDVTTLRDMHVGLPRGSYGFTFRGQRLRHLEQQQQQHSILSGGSDHHEAIALPEPRDFLCAVNTLEDAQMWVVALQWAASERMVVESVSEMETLHQQQQLQQSRPQLTTSISSSMLSTAEGFVNITSPSAAAAPTPTTSATTVAQQRPTPGTTTTTASSSSRGRSGGGGKMVVTKVTTVRTVRVSTWQWDLAYEIHILFVSSSWTSSSSAATSAARVRRVERWTALRTARDLWQLIHALHHEVAHISSSTSSRDVLVCWKQPIQDLPKLENKQHSKLSSLQQSLIQSIATVDGILRSLVTDAIMVRTNALQAFLGLSTAAASTLRRQRQPSTFFQRLWDVHNGWAVVERRIETMPEEEKAGDEKQYSVDAYVKHWLQTTPTHSAFLSSSSSSPAAQLMAILTSTSPSSPVSLLDSCTAFVLQRPFMLWGGVGVSSVAALWPLCRWAFSLYGRWIPSISIRADALVMTWIGAAYLGYQYHQAALPSTASSSRPYSKTTAATAKITTPNNNNMSGAAGTTAVKPKKEQAKPSGHPDASEEEEGVEVVPAGEVDDDDDEDDGVIAKEDDDGESSDGETAAPMPMSSYTAASMGGNNGNDSGTVLSPLPKYPENNGKTCWSQPAHNIFHVRSVTYLKNRVKEPSGPAPLTCRGIDVWMTDNPERYIARHPAVLGGKLGNEDTFLVNFLLPFGNFVCYFSIPPLNRFPPKLQTVWKKFLQGDQEYRDARLKLLPVVAEGPWIVKAAVGPGKTPAVLGKVIPLQYYFRHADPTQKRAAVYEVDVIITASSIAKGILSVVKGHTKSVSLAFAFIIEAAEQEELPETVLCSCQVHSLHLEECPILPPHNLDANNNAASNSALGADET